MKTFSQNFKYINLYKPPERKLTSPDDFGDQQTVGIHLKRSGKDFNSLGENDFGIYLGIDYERKYVIGIKHFATWAILGFEIYDTLKELKTEWTSD